MEGVSMKTKVFIGALLLMWMMSLAVYGQTVSWEIKLHNSDNGDILEREVSAYVDNGYVPLGITYDNVELYILYVHDPEFAVSAWSIEWYDNRESVRSGITTNMENGYIPTGITYTGDLFYVLYLQTDSSADAWQLIPSGTNLQSVKQEIQPYINQGYVPVGVTLYEEEYWTLLLNIPDTTINYWRLETYDVGTHGDAINRNIEEGYFPWGVMYFADTGEIDILYVGF
jgi:hypothetical protein